jgi:predicted anti-sigma-YlaC factor YlaD
MDCDQVREALSARLDGEDPALAPARLDSHVAGCPDCAPWLQRAEQVTLAARQEWVDAPDLTAAVLAAVAADTAANRRPAAPRRNVLRAAVAVIAVAQLALALPVLVGADAHLSREVAVFEMALAVGFAFVAWRPEWARGLVPVAVVVAAGLALTSVVDLAGAQVNPLQESGHLAAVVQAALLWALARMDPPRPRAGKAAVAVPA